MKRKKMPMRHSGRVRKRESASLYSSSSHRRKKNKATIRSKSLRGHCVVGAFGNTVTLSKDTPSNDQRVHDFPLDDDASVDDAYYEAQLVKLPHGSTVGLGFVLSSRVSSLPVDTLPGWNKHTVGVHTDDGGVYLGGNGGDPVDHVPRTFKEGDVVGIGHRSTVGFFVTVNGSRVWRERTPPSTRAATPSSKPKTKRDVAIGLVGMDSSNAVVVLNKSATHPVDAAEA